MSQITKPVILDETGRRMAGALEEIAVGMKSRNRVLSLTETPLVSGVFDVLGIPVYLEEMDAYADYGLTEKGWYVFARILAPSGVMVSGVTTVTGAAGSIVVAGADHVDVALRFGVTAESQRVTVNWDGDAESFVFQADDLAVRNLDYRVTFYVYDADRFATWSYVLTTDTTFATEKSYFTEVDGAYALAEVTAGEAIPVYYTLVDQIYTQATGVFAEGVTYYTKSGDVYTEVEVTTGEAIPAYYVHSKVTIEGMARNVTYRLNEIIDCPMEFILPEVEDELHGCWFEIRCRHAGEYSMTLVPPSSDVKIATEHTQKETAGFNTIDLHYNVIDGVKLWRFLNTHSTIPT